MAWAKVIKSIQKKYPFYLLNMYYNPIYFRIQVLLLLFLFFFFNDTATTEIYTLSYSFPTRRSSDHPAGAALEQHVGETSRRRADIEAVETFGDRKSTRLNSSHIQKSRMPSSA